MVETERLRVNRRLWIEYTGREDICTGPRTVTFNREGGDTGEHYPYTGIVNYVWGSNPLITHVSRKGGLIFQVFPSPVQNTSGGLERVKHKGCTTFHKWLRNIYKFIEIYIEEFVKSLRLKMNVGYWFGTDLYWDLPVDRDTISPIPFDLFYNTDSV